MKSRSFNQLKGDWVDVADLKSDCDPIVTVEDLGIYTTVGGGVIDPARRAITPANPCGLVAKSLFNDTFTLMKGGTPQPLNDNGIAWESDIKYKFHNLINPPNGTWMDWQWTNVTNEHFIVWMRTAGLPNFRKLYGKFESDL